MAKSNKSKFAVMGMLALVPKSSGYDIKKMMEGSTEYFWKETYSSIYPVLEALIEEGLIVKEEDLLKKARRRNVYELTEEGKKALKEWADRPVEYEQFRNELLLKLFFGELVPLTTTRKHIEEFKQMLVKKNKVFHTIKGRLQLEQKGKPGLPYWLMTLDFGLRQTKSALDWCEYVLEQYDQK